MMRARISIIGASHAWGGGSSSELIQSVGLRRTTKKAI